MCVRTRTQEKGKIEMRLLGLVLEAAMKLFILLGFAYLIAHTMVWLWKMGG